jgi:hydroxylamine reductase (hybrid-cluster protein)
MPKEYTPKQIEKYKRQKYISALNKCTKNLFKLFRDDSTTYDIFKAKFKLLKEELDNHSDIRLNSEHSKKSKEYIENLYKNTIKNVNFTHQDFLDIKSSELTKLNRLQKLKNRTKYSKEKYKDRYIEN